MKQSLIAPCGMNCAICLGYLREKNKCNCCGNLSPDFSGYCNKCVIRNCDFFKTKKAKFCYACAKFPCARLKALDKRYRLNYGMSMLENLENIKTLGMKKFIKNQKTMWTCQNCGKTLCVHRKVCLNCNVKRDNK